MLWIYGWMQRRAREIMRVSMILNVLIFIVLASGAGPWNEFTLRVLAGFFLMGFVLAHGWSEYGFSRIVHFFIITLTVAWSLETLSIATGFPFGRFEYTESLGIRIGAVPLMIIPAYFFNGYLAWTMARQFVSGTDRTFTLRQVATVPLIASLLMTFWNLSFEPVMSGIGGHWIWHSSGSWLHVPLSNTAGWLLTNWLIFLVYALLVFGKGPTAETETRPSMGYLIPVMYLIQGLPGLLGPVFRQDPDGILYPVALITLLTMGAAAGANLLVVHRRFPRSPNPVVPAEAGRSPIVSIISAQEPPETGGPL